ncbi:hypothetical protein [Amycolatopsis sp. SID8362]|uniref:hypothetical protein n=1 Tax=Amycolatopsis sp. SID8362 TaxID=2690346 RepID=UPI00136A2EF7|nr:hypothetical protein [Amycolatopsis sp. SID8362]NBH06039.1 hypothetical protein [Amycolatopsis sp. SID8362]NED42738.1 hypothetical protein [Amycolatopsis sp. SID8362]
MTTGTGSDDDVDRYVVLQRKSVLFPAVVAAAYRLHDLPVWDGRDAVDPSALSAAVEDAVLQAAFFCGEELTATLDRLLVAARARVEITRDIHASSRPGFGGRVHEDFRADDESGRRELGLAMTAFADAARADLRLSGTWGFPRHGTS